VSANACPKCQKRLPDAVVQEIARGGTFCPFCAAPLKRAPRRSLDAPLTGDEGYASFELEKPIKVNTTLPPSPKPAALAAALKPVATTAAAKPATTAAVMPKSMRATMVGTSVAPGELPFNGTPALGSFSALSGPALALPVRGPAPPLPSAKPATAAAVSPMAATMLAAPAQAVSPTDSERLDEDTGNAGHKDNLGYARSHEDQDKSRGNSHFQVPLVLHGSFAEPRGSRCDQADNGGVEPLEYPLDVRQMMKMIVRDGEPNHH